MAYMSVERPTMQAAFTAAHKAAEQATAASEWRKFRNIARLIWQACGEEKPDPILAQTLTKEEVENSDAQ